MKSNNIHYIFSVHRPEANLTLNHLNTIKCSNDLKDQGVQFTVGEGRNNGEKKVYFLVAGYALHERIIAALCKKYGKENYLKVYPDNATELVSVVTREVKTIGSMLKTDKPKGNDFSFFNGKFFEVQ